MTISIATFACVLTAILAAYRFFVERPEQDAHRRLRQRVTGPDPRHGERLDVDHRRPADLMQRAARADLTRRWYYLAWARVKQLIDQAGWTVRARTVIVLAAVGLGLPLLLLVHARRRRLRRFEALLPDAVDVMARAIRTGHPLPTALQIVGEDMPDPVGSEFRRITEHFRFGVPLADAMREFADRVPLVDARFLATAILLQRETGGNLPELLDNLAAVIRDRIRVRQHLQTCTAHGRLTGWILGSLPPAITLALLIVSPDYMRTLAFDPIGHALIGFAVMLEVIGVIAIRRIVRVEY